jgi:myo-inositol 2-dehydrogenase/D-chiro-inositol 1-dehydrogenase
MGRTHLRALADAERVRVVAVAEPAEQARSRAETDGLRAHRSVAQMLDGGGLDAVLVCAPTNRHVDLIEQIAAAGLPILCEKPCGLTSAHARRAAELSAAAGVPLQVAYWRRYVPALRVMRERIASGALGRLHLVCCFQWDCQPPGPSFRVSSGGIFIDMGVHEFDQIRWLTGQRISGISTAAAVVPTQAVPGDVDSAQLLARLSDETVGMVSLGRFHPAGDMARAEVFGETGSLRTEFLDPADGDRAQLAALRAQAEDFARLVRDGRSDGANADDAIAALEVAEKASGMIAVMSGRPVSATSGHPE